jgi:formamidopyrimidine-DNA glycosylase
VPELPDITVYIEALAQRLRGQTLEKIRIQTPFLLRSVAPPPSSCEGQSVTGLRRVGKRIAIGFANGHWLVLHLMIAGRLHWKKPGASLNGRQNLAAFDFPNGSLTLTEAGRERRASLLVAADDAGVEALDPGGIDVLTVSAEEFAARLTAENHTLKRILTDPRHFSGIGNAYSDEILHHARLSPIALTQKMRPDEIGRLRHSIRAVLTLWIDRLRAEAAGGFPEGVTAFRQEMAVHGKYGKACPVCGDSVQRIRYANNETNYCPGCQTEGRLLADRALSRLLGSDFPRTLDALEDLRRR